MKVLETIKKVCLTILGVIFFVFALCMTLLLLNYNDYGVTQFGDTSLILIKGDVSSDNYKKGDLVIVESKKIKDLVVGDEVFTYNVGKDHSVSIDLGTIGEIYVEEDAISFENGATYSAEFIAGQATKVYHTVGTFVSLVTSQWGFLFVVLVPGFLIFIYELYALIVEIKYGDEE